MKKYILGVAFMLSVAISPVAASAAVSTWQVYNSQIDELVVYKGDTVASGEYFRGKAEDYSGTATNPAAPTYEYGVKQGILQQIAQLEYNGKQAEADALRDKYGY